MICANPPTIRSTRRRSNIRDPPFAKNVMLGIGMSDKYQNARLAHLQVEILLSFDRRAASGTCRFPQKSKGSGCALGGHTLRKKVKIGFLAPSVFAEGIECWATR